MDTAKALRELSMPQMRGEKIVVIIERCARLAGLSYSRCFEMYYGRARRIGADEIARISDALKQKQALEARNELQELRIRLARLESLLALSDQEYDRENAGSFRGAVHQTR